METVTLEKHDWILKHTPESVRDRVAASLERAQQMTEEDHAKEEHRRMLAQAKTTLQQYRQRAHDNCGLCGDQWLHTFDSFKLAGTVDEKNNQAEALRWARAFVEEFPNTKGGGLFFGRPGVGKDFFLHCIVQAVLGMEAIYDVRYFYSLDIERKLKTQWYGGEEGDLEQCMRECDLLMIGDLHKILHVQNEAVRNIVCRVIKQACDVGRPTMVCTSMIPVRSGPVWKDGERMDYETRFGEAMASWIEGTMELINVLGPDRRKRVAA